MAMGKRQAAAGVAVRHGRRTCRSRRAIRFIRQLNRLLAEAELRSLDRTPLPAVLRTGGEARPALASRRASTSACCWSATSRGSTASAASPGGAPTASRLREFLGIPLDEATPDHSTLTNTRKRLPPEVFDEVFQFVLAIAAEKKLLSGKTVGVDSTTLEANAAMKSIVRRDTGEDWKEYVTRLMREEGVIEPDARADRRRASPLRQTAEEQEGVSNDEWVSPTDPESRITQMKDGRTHLAYKAEHVVDLESDLILAAEIHPADHADTQTLVDSVLEALRES